MRLNSTGGWTPTVSEDPELLKLVVTFLLSQKTDLKDNGQVGKNIKYLLGDCRGLWWRESGGFYREGLLAAVTGALPELLRLTQRYGLPTWLEQERANHYAADFWDWRTEPVLAVYIAEISAQDPSKHWQQVVAEQRVPLTKDLVLFYAWRRNQLRGQIAACKDRESEHFKRLNKKLDELPQF